MGKESKKKVIFWGLDWLDLLLAAAFIGLLALVGNLLYPPYGWGAGIAIALLLLYIAKRKREHNTDTLTKEE